MAISIIAAMKKVCNKIINLNSSKIDIAAFQKLYGTKENLTINCTPATNWNAPSSKTAVLMGDKLLVSITIERKSNYSAGNITNQSIGTFTVNTKGAILNAYSGSIPKAYYGQMVSVTYGTQTFKLEGSGSSQVLTFDMQLNAAHAAGAKLSFRFVIPVRPNLTYFGF